MPSLLLLGHRGDRRAARENTLSAFDRALENGCDGFEFDVRLTLDGQAVVFHDAKILGMSIAQNRFSRLAALDHGRQPGDRLCRLEDVMPRYAANAFLDIELKVPGLEENIIALVNQYRPERGYVVSSFLPAVLRTIGQRTADLPLGLICQDRRMLPQWRELPIQYVVANYRLISAELIDAIHKANRKVLVWTVNRPSTLYRMARLAVDGIISNDTRLMVQTLRGPLP